MELVVDWLRTRVPMIEPSVIEPPRRRPLPRWPDRLITASTFAAWACLALIVAGLVVGVVPVKNPKVQDCGTPLAFVLTGRVDTFVDPNSPPRGMTAKQAEAANRHPCRKRVAPARFLSGGLLLGALVIGLAGATMLVVGRSGRRRPSSATGLPRRSPAPA